MTNGDLADPPDVLRRKVRNILRLERESREVTQREAAQRVYWSQSKLIRIETGASPAAPGDVQALLREYGVDESRVAEVVELTKASRQSDEWDQFKDVQTPSSLTLFANERASALIQKYEPSLVPGLLQTEEYARALMKEVGAESSKVDARLRARERRQEIFLDKHCPQVNMIIGEAAVSRPIGGYTVMRNQIEHLKTVASYSKVNLQLLTFSRGAHSGIGSAFTVLEFNDAEIPDLVYLESADHDSFFRDNQEEVDKYNRRFAELRDLADGPEELGPLLDEIARYRFGGSKA